MNTETKLNRYPLQTGVDDDDYPYYNGIQILRIRLICNYW